MCCQTNEEMNEWKNMFMIFERVKFKNSRNNTFIRQVMNFLQRYKSPPPTHPPHPRPMMVFSKWETRLARGSSVSATCHSESVCLDVFMESAPRAGADNRLPECTWEVPNHPPVVLKLPPHLRVLLFPKKPAPQDRILPEAYLGSF